MDSPHRSRLAVSLRQIAFPVLVFLICLQAFQILMMRMI